MTRQRSSATTLALAYTALVVYASLYPFDGWRWPASPDRLYMLRLPWPVWRDRFDEIINVLGYMPLGALLYAGVVRRGGRWWVGAMAGMLLPALLAYAMEVVQAFLPQRVPSMRDWVGNSGGALLGVLMAAALHRVGFMERWQAVRERWFVRHSAGAIALLLLWPLGLLFPAPLPLGLGQIGDELRALALAALADTPWLDEAQPWLEASGSAALVLSPLRETLGTALGLAAPCLLAFAVTRPGWRRLVMIPGALVLGFGVTTLSTALNFGPQHALTWLTPNTLPALAAGSVLVACCSFAGRRLAAGIALVALSALLSIVAQAPADGYLSASLQAWEQGRFIRFHGLARWIGWLWPYAAIGWLLTQLAQRDLERADGARQRP